MRYIIIILATNFYFLIFISARENPKFAVLNYFVLFKGKLHCSYRYSTRDPNNFFCLKAFLSGRQNTKDQSPHVRHE